MDQPTNADLSHDLRTPLNHVIGYSELLSEELADRGQQPLTVPLQAIRALGKQLVTRLRDVFSEPQTDPFAVRLRAARPDFIALAEQITAHTAALEPQMQQADQSALLGDVHKINAAVANFLALVAQSLPPEAEAP